MERKVRAQFEELSMEVFGHKNAYKSILKKGFRYVDQQARCLKVQSFTEQQLMQTMIESIKQKQAKAEAAETKETT